MIGWVEQVYISVTTSSLPAIESLFMPWSFYSRVKGYKSSSLLLLLFYTLGRTSPFGDTHWIKFATPQARYEYHEENFGVFQSISTIQKSMLTSGLVWDLSFVFFTIFNFLLGSFSTTFLTFKMLFNFTKRSSNAPNPLNGRSVVVVDRHYFLWSVPSTCPVLHAIDGGVMVLLPFAIW